VVVEETERRMKERGRGGGGEKGTRDRKREE
jgi:hypothetical protein